MCKQCDSFNSLVLLAGTNTLLFCLLLFRQKYCVNIWKYSTTGYSHVPKKFVKLVIISYRQLNVSRNNPFFLVIFRSVPSKFKYFSNYVLEYSSQIHWCSCSNSLRITTLSEISG